MLYNKTFTDDLYFIYNFMKSSKEEERSDGGFYTNSHVYVNSVGDKRLLSSDRALEDEVVYANT